jgi:hypothetical protein
MLSISRSRIAIPVQFSFLIVNAVALLLGLAYNHETPELYENNAHSKIGWIVTYIASAWVFMAVVQMYASSAKEHPLDDAPAHPMTAENMAHYQCVHDDRLPDPSRFSNDSGQGTEPNSASLYGHSRSPSVESENIQFLGPTRQYTEEDGEAFDDGAEKRGFLHNGPVDRFLSRNVARFVVGRPLKYLRFLYVVQDRTLLVQGFVAITSGTVVYGGIGVSVVSASRLIDLR